MFSSLLSLLMHSVKVLKRKVERKTFKSLKNKTIKKLRFLYNEEKLGYDWLIT
jgi:hypothetical protein